jgi:hypothetical protein
MKPCRYCETLIDAEIHEAEFGMCLECSNAYFEHDHDGCSWGCMAAFNGKASA